MNIAVFGGAFNPIHTGHVMLAERVVQECKIDKVIFIPTYISPHKETTKSVSYIDRMNMCELATCDKSSFVVSDIESKIAGKSYSYITLQKLKETYSEDKLFLIVGADMYLSLMSWKKPETIFRLCDIITCPRDEGNYNSLLEYSYILKDKGCKTHILKEPIIKLSSTYIRENPVRAYDKGFINPKVFDYIKKHGLYNQ